VGFGEIIRFGVAGGVNVAVTFAVYAALVTSGAPYVLANLLAWILGIVCAYYLNLIFVFKRARRQARQRVRQFALFAALYIASFGLSSLALVGLVESGLLGPLQAQLIVIPLVAMFNFFSSKVFVFHTRET
jgi:putative flippase GtrA